MGLWGWGHPSSGWCTWGPDWNWSCRRDSPEPLLSPGSLEGGLPFGVYIPDQYLPCSAFGAGTVSCKPLSQVPRGNAVTVCWSPGTVSAVADESTSLDVPLGPASLLSWDLAAPGLTGSPWHTRGPGLPELPCQLSSFSPRCPSPELVSHRGRTGYACNYTECSCRGWLTSDQPRQ